MSCAAEVPGPDTTSGVGQGTERDLLVSDVQHLDPFEIELSTYSVPADLPDPATAAAFFAGEKTGSAALQFLETALSSGALPLDDGFDRIIHPGAIFLHDAHLLYYLTRSLRPEMVVETGFGYGLSAALLLSAMRVNGRGTLVSMDPILQSPSPAGVRLLAKLGLEGHRPVAEPSALGLAAMAAKYREPRLKLSFVDGSHHFDAKMIDFYLLDRMTEVHGIIALHDPDGSAVETLISFIEANRPYRVARPVSTLAICQKLEHDTRLWDHFVPFHVSQRHHGSGLI